VLDEFHVKDVAKRNNKKAHINKNKYNILVLDSDVHNNPILIHQDGVTAIVLQHLLEKKASLRSFV
jgi:hypothetical protein